MRAVSLKAIAVATVAASALVTGAATAQAANGQQVSKASKKGQSVSVVLPKFKGGDLAITVDATGLSKSTHTLTLYVNGRKFTAKSYTDKDKAKTWAVNNLRAGDVKLAAPASKGQVTTVTIAVKHEK
ncbi:hypothetical protein [Actinacidiphila oryziradicis]|uniref:DUF5666 domain-containing protein n=1 Tax=Actinacidiphila oryziradicis TaxID=2571141 RepID=A0A4U0SRH0_9ACTN|nr:hypothetical protein [Actinacidiphila oryziradicis]TKA12612.1 hypothetical protein FCI23_04250 [Actinacidiphila oryziradicis]